MFGDLKGLGFWASAASSGSGARAAPSRVHRAFLEKREQTADDSGSTAPRILMRIRLSKPDTRECQAQVRRL